MPSFAGAEQADRLRRGGDRSENAEAPHEPDVLHGTVLLSHTMHDAGLETGSVDEGLRKCSNINQIFNLVHLISSGGGLDYSHFRVRKTI